MWRSLQNAWFNLTRDERRALLVILALVLTGLAARACWYRRHPGGMEHVAGPTASETNAPLPASATGEDSGGR